MGGDEICDIGCLGIQTDHDDIGPFDERAAIAGQCGTSPAPAAGARTHHDVDSCTIRRGHAGPTAARDLREHTRPMVERGPARDGARCRNAAANRSARVFERDRSAVLHDPQHWSVLEQDVGLQIADSVRRSVPRQHVNEVRAQLAARFGCHGHGEVAVTVPAECMTRLGHDASLRIAIRWRIAVHCDDTEARWPDQRIPLGFAR